MTKAALLSSLALAALPAALAADWEGEIPWVIYGEAACGGEDTVVAAGATMSLAEIAPGVLCETDSLELPNGTSTTWYTKAVAVECGAESAEWDLFDCADAMCSMCDEAPAADGIMPNSVSKGAYANVDECLLFYPKDAIDFEGVLVNMTAQQFDTASVDISVTRAYWDVWFGRTCGAEWMEANVLTTDEEDSWSGELPWTLYGPGGCGSGDESSVAATGTTTLIKTISPGVLCETDEFDTPNGTVLGYTKVMPADCGSESAEFLLFNCEDEACNKCDETPEIDGVLPNSVIKEFFEDASACFAWYPKGTSSFGDVSDVTAQAFDPSVALADTQAYWSFLFGNTCGVTWWEDHIISESGGEGTPPPTPSASSALGITASYLIGLVGWLVFVW